MEYAKNTPDDLLISITVANRGPQTARIHVLPTLWYRNTWTWRSKHEECTTMPQLTQTAPGMVECYHDTLGKYIFAADVGQDGQLPELLFTNNETNLEVNGVALSFSRFFKRRAEVARSVNFFPFLHLQRFWRYLIHVRFFLLCDSVCMNWRTRALMSRTHSITTLLKRTMLQ